MSGNFAPLSPSVVGFFRYDTVTGPGGGNNFTFTAPAGVLRCVQAVRITFSASGVAGDRYCRIVVKNQGSTTTMISIESTAITAAQVKGCFWDILGPFTPAEEFNRTTFRMNLPPVWLLPGDTLGSEVTGILVGDQITQIQIASICYAWV